MATEAKPAAEEAKMDLFEDDDEFEEFEINEGLVLAYIFFFTVGLMLPFETKTVISSALSDLPALDYIDFSLPEWEAKEDAREVTQQWEDDWDDDDVNDDFSLQLRRELESNEEKK